MNKFDLNVNGADYVVGDIHGCFSKLQETLNGIGFNPEVDRLFSVGDLVDRGPESEEFVDWLAYPWFHAIKGNHEQMMIDWADGYMVDATIYDHNGGSWFRKLPKADQKYLATIAKDLPLWMEVTVSQLGVKVGMVHGDAPADWNNVDKTHEHWLLWGRQRFQRKLNSNVENIDRVYVGHTPVKEKQVYGNVHYIDTGAVFGGKFHIERIN